MEIKAIDGCITIGFSEHEELPDIGEVFFINGYASIGKEKAYLNNTKLKVLAIRPYLKQAIFIIE